MSTVTTTTTTTTRGGGTAVKGSKPVSIALIVLGGVGFVLGIAAIIYSVHGLTLGFKGLNIEEIQANCRKTFSTATAPGWQSVDTKVCSTDDEIQCPVSGAFCNGTEYCKADNSGCGTCPYNYILLDLDDIYNDNRYVGECPSGEPSCTARCYGKELADAQQRGERLGTYMCGHRQFILGCSVSFYEASYFVSAVVGVWSTSIGSIFVIIASIPILANGLFGFFNNELLARISGGFGVGCSVVGFCGASSCMIAAVVASIISYAITAEVDKVLSKTKSDLCSTACQESKDKLGELGKQVVVYYTVITVFVVALMIVAIADIIVASVSCCLWKTKQTPQTHYQQSEMTTVEHTKPAEAAVVVAVAQPM